MPHSPDAPSPLMTVTGNTLVLAQWYAPDKDSGTHSGTDSGGLTLASRLIARLSRLRRPRRERTP
ncbi:hypothetical protein ACIOJD_06905 [Streptomyces sp. NPDC088116]|uniref:hypothetical protein n=1 Tax=Streptomyces sp. NPDC088116 TaxID=3365825 RepID=UPI0037F94082